MNENATLCHRCGAEHDRREGGVLQALCPLCFAHYEETAEPKNPLPVEQSVEIREARERARMHLYAVDRMLYQAGSEIATAAAELASVKDNEGFKRIPSGTYTLRKEIQAAREELSR